MNPAPGYVVLKRIENPNKDYSNSDFQNEHLMLPTWGEIISIGPVGKRPFRKGGLGDYFATHFNGLWSSVPEGGKDISVGDTVSFLHLYNTNEREYQVNDLGDGYLLVRYDDLRCKLVDGIPYGVGVNETVEMIIEDSEFSGIHVARKRNDSWDRGMIKGRLAVLYPKMAIPVEYAHVRILDSKYYVINKKYIFGYGRRAV